MKYQSLMFIVLLVLTQQAFAQTIANSGILTSPPSTNLKLQTGGTDRLTILNSNGNVGIGTSTPNTKLDIYGGRLTQQGAIPNDNNAVFVNTDATGYGIYSKGGLNTHYSFHFENQAGTSIMYGRGDGNVGIGTTDPKYPLTVKGRMNSEANGDYYGAWLGGEARTDKPSVNVGSWWNNKGSIYWNSNKMIFLTQTSSTDIFDNSLVLDQGNVGIGTSIPDAKLAVNGTVHAKEVKVDLNVPGPDYVFEKNYPLTSLEEIKSYIIKNKHLPEVPSAKEMETKGINLSEMNMLLLKKIEELTLHMIELKKASELQQIEIQKLNNHKNEKK